MFADEVVLIRVTGSVDRTRTLLEGPSCLILQRELEKDVWVFFLHLDAFNPNLN